MKKLVVIGAMIGLSACTAADQKKVNDAADMVSCKVAILKPYAKYFTSAEFLDALENKDYVGILVAAGVTPEEVEATVNGLKKCHLDK